MSSIALPHRQRLIEAASLAHRKGKILAHLLGMVLASEFMVGAAAGKAVPYVSIPLFTAWLDFPVRLIALWLIVDRNWRLGRLKVGYFDILILGYCGIVGLVYPYTAQDPSVNAALEWYRGFAGDMLRFWIISLIVREGYNRAGFDGRIMIRWVVAALAFSASLALLQAVNFGPARDLGLRFYQQPPAYPGEPYRAAGAASHWNGFASEMVLALLLVWAPLNYRPLRWYEYAFGLLFSAALVVSTSRGGYVTFAAVALAASLFFLWTRRPRIGLSLAAMILASVSLFGYVVVSYQIPRFKDLLEPPKVRSADLGSLDYRLERARQLTERGMDRPITGTGPSDVMWHNNRTIFRSASSVEGILDVSYPVIFAELGMLGLAYTGALVFYFLRFFSRRRAVHPYAALIFLTGVAFAVHSVTEMLLRSQVMILVSVVAGIAASRVVVRSDEFGRRRLEPRGLHANLRHG